MTESENQQNQQKLQLTQFSKIKSEFEEKLHFYRDSYESTNLGIIYSNKRILLSEIVDQIKQLESQFNQLQVFLSFNYIFLFKYYLNLFLNFN
jgi:hypothetical protein